MMYVGNMNLIAGYVDLYTVIIIIFCLGVLWCRLALLTDSKQMIAETGCLFTGLNVEQGRYIRLTRFELTIQFGFFLFFSFFLFLIYICLVTIVFHNSKNPAYKQHTQNFYSVQYDTPYNLSQWYFFHFCYFHCITIILVNLLWIIKCFSVLIRLVTNWKTEKYFKFKSMEIKPLKLKTEFQIGCKCEKNEKNWQRFLCMWTTESSLTRQSSYGHTM